MLFIQLGKGTSTVQGASLAGAILEVMDSYRMNGIFATHLHELFDMNLNFKNIQRKTMEVEWING